MRRSVVAAQSQITAVARNYLEGLVKEHTVSEIVDDVLHMTADHRGILYGEKNMGENLRLVSQLGMPLHPNTRVNVYAR